MASHGHRISFVNATMSSSRSSAKDVDVVLVSSLIEPTSTSQPIGWGLAMAIRSSSLCRPDPRTPDRRGTRRPA